jgi:hypothetical protein
MMANEFAGLYIEVDKKPLKLSKKIKENWEDCLFFIAEKLELIAEKIKPY